MSEDIDVISKDIVRLIESGQSALLHQVLEMYPILVDRRDINERTWMHHAAEAGTWGCLAVLKTHGLDVSAIDVMGETPLHRALTRHHRDTVEWLLQEGANPNAATVYGSTPTLYAAGWAADVMTGVIEAGGDPDVRDRNGDGIEEWAKRGVRMAAQAAKLPKMGR